MLKGFREFIMRGNVIDLAIAVVIGTAFAALVKALVSDLLTPLIAAITGSPNFGSLHFTLHHSTFLYGDVVNALITFVAVAIVVYFFVVFPMNKLAERRARGKVEVTELPPDIALLTEIRDLLAAGDDGGPKPALP
ncbi:MAG TPA: large conductance mechanosensitive channel protein MscL [Acidimicrobiales bacterium]|nr:large conductance mechanosensitive channel protein MscL [Acidimicrobiales bacterium]